MFRVIFVTLFLAAFAVCVHAQEFEVEGSGDVTWVADGDTFRFQPSDVSMWRTLRAKAVAEQNRVSRDLRVEDRFWSSNHTFLVRVGNIDTAESQHPDERRNSQEGKDAAAFSKAFLANVSGTLYCWEIGHYGRPVCSLWTDEWEFGTTLIEGGYAEYETDFGAHPRFHQKYLDASTF